MASAATHQHDSGAQLFGHPVGLFTLFFAEMWERFSYYGMRALLLFYMIKGFLGYPDSEAYAVYGAYTALVYMTPFFGGMLADRLLGPRRAVIFGGLLMAAGHLLMTWEQGWAFFSALALLIVGNGFFKPNISTIVGTLYPKDSPKRDGGFTIFYMGINLGASMSPLLCGYIGETYGWHWGFGLATIGMLVGLIVFIAPTRFLQVVVLTAVLAVALSLLFGLRTAFGLMLPGLGAVNLMGWHIVTVLTIAMLAVGLLAPTWFTQFTILAGALAAAVSMLWFHPENWFSVAINAFISVSLLVAGVVAVLALNRGHLPRDAGAPPGSQLHAPLIGPLTAEWTVYLGTLLLVPVFALLVSGFAPLTENNQAVSIVSPEFVKSLEESDSAAVQVLAVVVREASRPAGLILVLAGLIAFGYLGFETLRLDKIARERMFVVLILTFFSMLFWAFFEQAGSSVNNFTDRNIDRVFEDRVVTADDVGQTLTIQPTQEQLGYSYRGTPFTLTTLGKLREENTNPNFTIEWPIEQQHIGMAIADRVDEIPASTMQSFNPVFILIFGLVFSLLWTKLGELGLEPSTPLKFSLGLFQLGLGFTFFWYGAEQANERGMVALHWLALGYLMQTTGELCISPVGLSMVTKLSPERLVATVMGTWFLATAFSQYLAAIIAQFTGVTHGDGEEAVIPIPRETVEVYGNVFGKIAIAAMISAAICLLLVPLLKRWMHPQPASDE